MNSKLLEHGQPRGDDLGSNSINNENIDLQQFNSRLPADIHCSDNYTIKKKDFQINGKNVSTTDIFNGENTSIYDNYVEEHLIPKCEDVEVITVDVQQQQQHQIYQNGIEIINACSSRNDKVIKDAYYMEHKLNVDDLTNLEESCSNMSDDDEATFRSRTDSSSIADYESHTSDYDDDDDIDNDVCGVYSYNVDDSNEKSEIKGLSSPVSAMTTLGVGELYFETGFLTADDLLLDGDLRLSLLNDFDFNDDNESTKKRTLSASFINDVDDGLISTDSNLFDLAEFISKDDYLSTNLPPVTPTAASTNLFVNTKQSTIIHQSPSLPPTSNTLAIKNNFKNKSTPIMNNITKCNTFRNMKETKSSNTFTHKIHNHISESDSDIIVDIETVETTHVSSRTPVLEEEDVSFVDNLIMDPSWCPSPPAKHGKLEMNQAKSKQQRKKPRDAIELKNIKMTSSRLPTPATDKIATANTDMKTNFRFEMMKQQQTTLKRKLNLEEYKKRRFGISGDSNNNTRNEKSTIAPAADDNPATKACHTLILENAISNKNVCSNNLSKATTLRKRSEAVVSIVKSLKAEQESKHKNITTITDPITEARKKVMRMQALKRAQQLKIIDSTVSAKVPRVTKLLPLKDIIKDTKYSQAINDNNTINKTKCQTLLPSSSLANIKNTTLQPDYEEIIVMSVSCNTDISIPPLKSLLNSQINTSKLQRVNKTSRSLLKSSLLLQKIQATEHLALYKNSLIASIQNAVVMKALPQQQFVQNLTDKSNAITTVVTNTIDSDNKQQHGENKIIMHLRKDRIRKSTTTIAIQTDYQPEFPIFPVPSSPSVAHRRKQYRKRTQSRTATTTASSSASCSSSSSTDSDSDLPPRLKNHSLQSCRNNSNNQHNNSSSAWTVPPTNNNSMTLEFGNNINGGCIDATGGYSSRSSRRHRSSISSSYSESERILSQRRQRRTSYKERQQQKHQHRVRRSSSASSSTSSTMSDYNNALQQNRCRTRSRSPTTPSSRSMLINQRYHHSGERSRSHTHRNCEQNNSNDKNYNDHNVAQPAVEERRIVYVGRIEQQMTKEMLKRKFQTYGHINQITMHIKETGMKYGFVTFSRSQDAFAAIDASARDPQISMYDISFGGRRAFCRASYADLDNAGVNTYHSIVFPKTVEPVNEDDESFEALLLKVKAKINGNKTSSPTSTAMTITRTPSAKATTISDKEIIQLNIDCRPTSSIPINSNET